MIHKSCLQDMLYYIVAFFPILKRNNDFEIHDDEE